MGGTVVALNCHYSGDRVPFLLYIDAYSDVRRVQGIQPLDPEFYNTKKKNLMLPGNDHLYPDRPLIIDRIKRLANGEGNAVDPLKDTMIYLKSSKRRSLHRPTAHPNFYT